MEVGINFPPFHAWCRSTFIRLTDGLLSRESKGNDVDIPKDENYFSEKLGLVALPGGVVVLQMRKNAVEWESNLTNREKQSIDSYIGRDYIEINRFLRGESNSNEKTTELIEDISAGIQRCKR